jgi:hypothetical protein
MFALMTSDEVDAACRGLGEALDEVSAAGDPANDRG